MSAPARPTCAPTSPTASACIKSDDGGTTWHADRSRRHPADRQDPGRPAQCRRGARGGAGPSLRTERGARRVPLHRRRPELDEDAVSRTPTPVPSTSPSAGRSGHRLRGAVADAAAALERLSAFQRPGQRPLQVDRRRQELDRDHRPRLAAQRPGRIGLAVAPNQPDRVYALVDAKEGGLYRSDDAGANWTQGRAATSASGSAAGISAASRSIRRTPDEVYVCDTDHVALRPTAARPSCRSRAIPPATTSTSCGSIRPIPTGAIPGVDQGTHDHAERRRDLELAGTTSRPASSITSSPTTAFPTGSTARSRIPARRACPAAPAAFDGINMTAVPRGHRRRRERQHRARSGRSRHRLWRPRGQARSARPARPQTSIRRSPSRTSIAAPGPCRSCSAQRDHALYFGNQRLFRTVDGGQHWTPISPDLTRPAPGVPANLDAADRRGRQRIGPRRGVVYAIAPSPLRRATASGRAPTTASSGGPRDGGAHWQDVTPKGLVRLVEGRHRSSHRTSTPTPPTSPSTAIGWTTSRPTSSAPATAARPGRRSSTASPTAAC